MLSYGAGSSLFSLLSSLSNVALTFKSARRASGGLLGFFRLPLRRAADPLTVGTILGAAPLRSQRVGHPSAKFPGTGYLGIYVYFNRDFLKRKRCSATGVLQWNQQTSLPIRAPLPIRLRQRTLK